MNYNRLGLEKMKSIDPLENTPDKILATSSSNEALKN